MIIQDSIVSIKFPRVDNIKKAYFENEEILKKEFSEATILPIPDDAPIEIPRIILKSKGEHSQLNIAPEAASIQIAYTDDYKENWMLCEQYITTKIENIFELTDILTEDNYNYVGLVTNILWNQDTEKVVRKLSDNLLKIKDNGMLHDLFIKYTFVEDNKYFVNISIQNVRVFNEKNSLGAAGSFKNSNLISNIIGITIDVNDRYSFNNNDQYKSDKDKFKDIMEITTTVINNKLETLISKGVYDYEAKNC